VEDYVILALFGLLLLRRTYRMTQGVPAGAGRLVVLPAFYVAIYVAELAGTWVASVGTGRMEWTYVAFAADALMLAVGTWLSYRITSQHVHVYQPAVGGPWYYRLRPLLPVLYVVLFFVRAIIGTVVIGIVPFGFPTSAQFDSISTTALVALYVVDALWGLTTGFLIGRSSAVYRAWKNAERSPPAPPAAPPPLPG